MDNDIKLMLYDEPHQSKMLFYLLGANPIDVLSVLPENLKIEDLKFVASKAQVYIYPEDVNPKETLKDLLSYFNRTLDYSIDHLAMTLADDIEVSVHDHCEITMILPRKNENTAILLDILEKFGYDAGSLLEHLKNHPNQYFQVRQPDIIEERYLTFEEYLEKMDAY